MHVWVAGCSQHPLFTDRQYFAAPCQMANSRQVEGGVGSGGKGRAQIDGGDGHGCVSQHTPIIQKGSRMTSSEDLILPELELLMKQHPTLSHLMSCNFTTSQSTIC